MRLVSYNIRHGKALGGRVDLSRTASALRPLDADVLCLQEVDHHFGARSAFADQAGELGVLLDREVTFGWAMRRGGGARPREYGNAVLSRSAPTGQRVLPLPGAPGTEPRSLLLLAFADGTTVGCTHLSFRSARGRAAQVDAILAALPEHGPLAVAGDWNAGPGARELAALAGRLRDAGGPATFPAAFPRRRLDQVWLRGWRPVRVDAPRSWASDHRPLVVDLAAPLELA